MSKVKFTRPERKTVDPAKLARSDSTQKITGHLNNKYPLSRGVLFRVVPEVKDQNKSLEDVLNLARSLTATERKSLLDHLALESLKSAPASVTRDQDMWLGAVLTGLQDAVGAGAEGMGGLMVIKRSLTPGSWQALTRFMTLSKFDGMTVTERQSIYEMLAKLVIEDARTLSRRTGAPLGPRLVNSCLAQIANIFDASFPAYLANGLALMVARRLTRGV